MVIVCDTNIFKYIVCDIILMTNCDGGDQRIEEIKKTLKETFDLYSTDESLSYKNGACDAIANVARHLGFGDDYLYQEEN